MINFEITPIKEALKRVDQLINAAEKNTVLMGHIPESIQKQQSLV